MSGGGGRSRALGADPFLSAKAVFLAVRPESAEFDTEA